MITDPTRMCELLVGLPSIRVLGIVEEADGPLFVHIETTGLRPSCPGCGATATVKDRDLVELVDLPAFGRRTRLVWRKRRWACPNPGCAWPSWTEREATIAAPRLVLTDRAGRWATEPMNRLPRPIPRSQEPTAASDRRCSSRLERSRLTPVAVVTTRPRIEPLRSTSADAPANAAPRP